MFFLGIAHADCFFHCAVAPLDASDDAQKEHAIMLIGLIPTPMLDQSAAINGVAGYRAWIESLERRTLLAAPIVGPVLSPPATPAVSSPAVQMTGNNVGQPGKTPAAPSQLV